MILYLVEKRNVYYLWENNYFGKRIKLIGFDEERIFNFFKDQSLLWKFN